MTNSIHAFGCIGQSMSVWQRCMHCIEMTQIVEMHGILRSISFPFLARHCRIPEEDVNERNTSLI